MEHGSSAFAAHPAGGGDEPGGVGERSGVARDTISKLETGRRGAYPSTIRKLAAGLEVRPQMLMGGVEYLDEPADGEPSETQPSEKPERDRRVGF